MMQVIMAENGLGDGVRPKIAPLAIGDSDDEEEDEQERLRALRSQTPTLPPIG